MRLYDDLADWYPILTPPDDGYPEEARALQALLGEARTVLELGCGAGHLAHHLTGVELVLTDLSPAMLDLSRALNPHAEHVQGDMRTLRLDRSFDAAFLHDAVHYLMTPEDLDAAVATAAAHLRPGGRCVVLPDFTDETFPPSFTDDGGSDAPDGRGLRYLEWSVRHPDGGGVMHFAMLLRHADGTVEHVHDAHRFSLFTRQQLTEALERHGFAVSRHADDWRADVFVGVLGG